MAANSIAISALTRHHPHRFGRLGLGNASIAFGDLDTAEASADGSAGVKAEGVPRER
jgi:hypothetical protein